MLVHSLKIARRHMKAHRLFTVLNLAGLSIGLLVSILLYLYILHERSFDTMYRHRDDIYRVLAVSEGYGTMATVPNAIGPVMSKEIPEVQTAARLIKHGFGTNAFIKVDNQTYTEKNFFSCDSTLFQIFDIPFLQGDPNTALTRPNTVVLSETIAQKYFGDSNPIGKSISVDNHMDLEVTGVFRDFPSNSTLDCEIMASFNTAGFPELSWSNASFETYVLLYPKVEAKAVETKMEASLKKNVDREHRWYTLSLQPLQKIHLYSAGYADSYSTRTGDIREVRNLSLLALLILLIACINYMNLSTARSQKRAKEVAISKTLGASAGSLIAGFYMETALLTFIALLAGVVLAFFALPFFSELIGIGLSPMGMTGALFLTGLLLIWMAITFISGSYPAFYLSGFTPLRAWKQSAPVAGTSALIRKGLVVLQFSSSVMLILAVMVIYHQMKYVREKNLGYHPQNVMAIDVTAARESQVAQLINILKSKAAVLSVSRAQSFPGAGSSGRTLYRDSQDQKGLTLTTNRSQKGIVDVLQLKLIAGTDLPQKAEDDTLVHILLNKTGADYLGFSPQEAVGKKVNAQLGSNTYIAGVVEDFNFASLKEPMGAYAFNDAEMEPASYLLVRFQSNQLSDVLADVEREYKQAIPGTAFDSVFLDRYLNTLYKSEQRMAVVVLLFSIMAIFVACLGLFGLASFTSEQRTKEVGVRKVLGASVPGISILLSKDILKPVLLSLLIAIPFGYWMMNAWLENFAYKTTITWWMIVVSCLAAVLIALATVSSQAIRAAMANPIKSLRTE